MVSPALFIIAILLFVDPCLGLTDIDKCIIEIRQKVRGRKTTKTLEGISGIGWDDLRNIVTLPVFKTNFKECRSDPDSQFLLPDNIVAIPVKEILIDKSTSTFKTFDSYMKESSDKITASVSGGAGGFTASASFSSENQESKKSFESTNSFMLKNKVSYKAFQLIADQNGGLHDLFEKRLREIADAISSGHPRLAKYIAQVLIADYGTHVVNKAIVGASIEQQVYIDNKESFSGEARMSAIKAEVAVGFEGVGSAKFGYENSNKESSNHTTSNSTTNIIIRAKGGPDVKRLATADLTSSIIFMDNLVALEHEGMFLHELIHIAELRGFSKAVKLQLEALVRDATSEYYRYNTLKGCTNASAESYNFMANTEDGSCIEADETFQFGGYYQICTPLQSVTSSNFSVETSHQCLELQQINIDTGNYSCGPTYQTTVIDQFKIEFRSRKVTYSKRVCKFYFFFFQHCANETLTEDVVDEVYVEAFWCRVNTSKKSNQEPEKNKRLPNKLDTILHHDILHALNNEPDLLKMYFPEEFVKPYNKTTVLPISPLFKFLAKTITGEDHSNITITVTPPSIKVENDQIDILADYPNVLRALIWTFTQAKNSNMSDEKDAKLYDSLSKNPILLKNWIKEGYSKSNQAPALNESSVLFGGIFSPSINNPITNTVKCPLNFKEYKLAENLKICLWKDQKAKWPISFGGTFNCMSSIKVCPRGYSEHLVSTDRNCPLFYCLRFINRKLFETPLINKPPFFVMDMGISNGSEVNVLRSSDMSDSTMIFFFIFFSFLIFFSFAFSL